MRVERWVGLLCGLVLVAACGDGNKTPAAIAVATTTAPVPTPTRPSVLTAVDEIASSAKGTVSTTAECDTMEHVQLTAAAADYLTLESVGVLGGALAVIRTSSTGPLTTSDERHSIARPAGSSGSGPLPFVVTRYTATIEQLVIWPGSAPVPNVGDDVMLDIEGGKLECFWFEVLDTMSLHPDAEYLVIATPDDGRWILAGGNQAFSISGGVISSADRGHVPTAIEPLLGTSVTDLPPLTIVPSSI